MRRNASLFILISLLGGFGSTAMGISAGLWLLDLSHSFSLAALASLCTYAPTFLGPWLGALVDRLPRRPLLIWVDLILGLLLLTLLTVHSAGGVWLIYAVLVARGISYVLLDAGESAILPAALPPDLLGDVNGWRSSAQEGMKLVAPLAGAGLYAWGGARPVILLCAAMPLLTAGCYTLVRLRPQKPTNLREVAEPGDGVRLSDGAGPENGKGPGPWVRPAEEAADGGAGPQAGTADGEGRGIRPGVRLLFRQRGLRVPVMVAAVAIPLSGVGNAPLLARIVHDLHLPATHLGILASAQGAGSIVGGLVVGRLLARVSPAGVAGVGAVLFAAGVAAWCLPFWPALIAGSVVVGIGLPWTLIAAVTAVQTGTPDHLLGRVSATSMMLMFGPVALAIPIGSVLVGLGAVGPLLGICAVALGAGVAGLREWRQHRATNRPAGPHSEIKEAAGQGGG